MRLAWFSPFPPVRTGIAACSADLVEALAARGHEVDRYPEAAAHDFVWRRRLAPYDLVVYQFGNSSHHDYEWAYALNHPGLVVLHDTHLHHARAAFLLREKRAADYRAELAWNHPEVSPDAAELAVAGFDSRLYYDWPMVRSLVASSRLAAVHGEGARAELLSHLPLEDPGSRIEDRQANDARSSILDPRSSSVASIRLGHGVPVSPERDRLARAAVRARHGIADDAVVFGCFGGLTPEKRIPQILAAFRALRPHAPGARLVLAGAPAAHYDVAADITAHGLTDHTTLAGYLESDEDLTDYLSACDVTLNLRWPTARETSGPWLRALAAGRATIITDLVHLGDVPSLDPRTWTDNGLSALGFGLREEATEPMGSVASVPKPKAQSPKPVCVAIDILDEDHSLRLAMRRLASDRALREQLRRAARDWWAREHSLEAMVDDYERVLREAAGRPDPDITLPAHMRNPGDRKLRALLTPFGLEALGRRRLGEGGR
ncbi:MAG TPA: glycosyltransferase family 4 protein [Vicinamibacterales bacterium]